MKEKIQTTEPKAKELRPFVEKLVTRAKVGTLAARRLLQTRLQSETGVKKLMTDLGPRFAKRSGGYLRITKLGRRTSDGSPLAQIEFV